MLSKNLTYLMIAFITSLFSCDNANTQTGLLESSEVYEKAHKLTNWLYSNELDSLIPHFVDKDYTIQNLSEFKDRVDNQLGEETTSLHWFRFR